MCGIAGIAPRAPFHPARQRLERMAARVRHRGPDEEGIFVEEGVGLAFRRLRVIDLAGGSQPMGCEDGSVQVIFNGEIYNHAELRRRLRARGHRFATRSDTEVLVHLYEEMGPGLVRELNGMFAFAIWDSRKRILLLARDPIGIKPLLWAETEEGLVFGSEMGAVLEAGGVDTSLDPLGVHHFLSWGAVPAPRTILRGVRRLPPAHVLIWRKGEATLRRYWHPLEGGGDQPGTFEEGARRLRELLEDSVRLRMVADVPLGAFLSGGVDSTTIVGLMARTGERATTFSIGFPEEPIFDETRWAREAAAFHGTDHRSRELSERHVREAIPAVLGALSEPFGSASILPAFAVCRETRREMTVALSGDGADELFGGYEKYLGETYRRWYARLPQPLRRRILEPALRRFPVSRSSRAGELSRKARRFLEGNEAEAAERHDRWMRYASAEAVSRLLGEERVRNPGLELIRRLHAEHREHGGLDAFNRILFTDLSLALPTDMLWKVDAASMLNSLEVRVPFLDRRIVQLVMSLPGSWKMQGTQRKRILKAAAADLLPEAIRHRPKAGFDVPVGEWLRGSMRDLFREVVFSEGTVPLDRRLLERWLVEHNRRRADHSKILWAVFALRWWEGRGRREPAPAQSRVEVERVA